MSDFSYRKALAMANDLLPQVLQHGKSPKDVLTKCASDNNMSPGKLCILAQAYNTVRANYHFKNAADRTAPFEVVDAKELESEYAGEAPKALKSVKADAEPASKTEQEEAERIGRKLLKLYRRKHGLDEDTGEGEKPKGSPSFEEWKKGLTDEEKAADYHEATVYAGSPWLKGLTKKVASAEAPAPAAPDPVKEASAAVRNARLIVRDTDLLLGQVGSEFCKLANSNTDAFAQTEMTLRGGLLRAVTDEELDGLAKTASYAVKRSSSYVRRKVDNTKGLTEAAVALLEARVFAKEARAFLKETEDREQVVISSVADAGDFRSFIAKLATITGPQIGGSPRPTQKTPHSAPAGNFQTNDRPDPKGQPAPKKDVDKGPPDYNGGFPVNSLNQIYREPVSKGSLPSIPTYESQMPEVFGSDHLKSLMGQIGTGDRKGQQHYDKAVKRLELQRTLQNLVTKDTVISAHFEADPERVADLAANVLDTAPNLTSNPAILRYVLREALAHDALPLSTATALTKGEKEVVDTKEKNQKMDAENYGSKSTLGALAGA